MYMSRVLLDPLRRKTIVALVNPNLFHGAIESAQPDHHSRILWRIDELNGKTYLMAVSSDPIDLQNIADQFGYEDSRVETKNYDPLLSKITDGSVWQFRLCANPVRSLTPELPKSRGKVVSYSTVKGQMEWLIQTAPKYGFRIDPDKTGVVGSKFVTFKKSDSSRTVRLRECTFSGVLTVTDADLFRKALTEGIGKGKAYGMGMLTVVPVNAG